MFHPEQTQVIYFHALPAAPRPLTVLTIQQTGKRTPLARNNEALVHFLHQRQHHVVVLGETTRPVDEATFHAIRWYRRWPGINTWQLWQVLSFYRPDIIYLDGFHHLLTVFSGQRLTHTGKIVVDFRDDFVRLASLLKARWLHRVVDAVIVHSHFARWWVGEKLQFPREKIFYVPYELDTRLFFPNKILRESWREAYGIHPDDVVIGTVLFEKSIRPLREIIMATRRISLRHRQAILALMVEKPLLTRTFHGILKEVQRIVGRTMRLLVVPLGSRHWEQIHLADVLFQPQGGYRATVPLLRAMASGVVPVGYNHGEIPELFVHNASGLLVPPFNWQVLAKTLNRLILDPSKRYRIQQGARQRALSEFAFPRVIEQLESAFYTILKQ